MSSGLLLMWLQSTIGWLIFLAFIWMAWSIFFRFPKRMQQVEKRIRQLEREQQEKEKK